MDLMLLSIPVVDDKCEGIDSNFSSQLIHSSTSTQQMQNR